MGIVQGNEHGETKLKPKMGEVNDDDLEDDEMAYNALDYGLNFGLGYQANHFLFNAGYSLGLGNMTANYEGSGDYRKDHKLSNRVITVSLAYLINMGD